MGLFEKDYLLRLLEELSEMIAAISASIRGGNARDALASIAQAQARLAGPLGGSLERLDPGSVVSLLGAEKAKVHARLLRLEAEAREALGEAAKAQLVASRAQGIERAAG
jgi:hypothetical protein